MKMVQKMKSFCRTGQKAFRVLENRCVRKYDKTSPEKVRLAFRVIMALAAIFTVIFLWAFGESLAILLGLFLLPCLIAILGSDGRHSAESEDKEDSDNSWISGKADWEVGVGYKGSYADDLSKRGFGWHDNDVSPEDE
ncbi:TPA: hypothetical protein OME38_004603 [Klebsiella oxytoca]|nr:hypothetical protein [Klebsiella oxytoca]